MVGATKSQNKADELRLQILGHLGCLPCNIDGWPGEPPTVQHVTEGGVRLKDQHQMTYPSCPWHHLGNTPDGVRGGISDCEDKLGPSFARNKRAFQKRYGSERQLVQMTDAMVRIYIRERYSLTENHLCDLAQSLYREIVLDQPPTRVW